MQHLEEGTIHAWLDGALSPDEQARVEQHVQQCAECASLVAEARGIIAGAARIVGALDIVPGGVIPKQRTAATGSGSLWRSLRLTPLRAALAASLMIAAASLITVRQNATRQFDMEVDSTVSVATPTASVPAPAPIPSAPVPTVAAAQDLIAAKPPTTGTANAPAAVERSKAKAAAAGASQPASGVVADAEPKKRDSVAAPVLALSEVVITSARRAPISADSVVANEARRTAQDARTDSARANAAKATVGAGREVVADRARMERAQGLVMTSAPSMDVAGCYQVSRDSSAVLGPLPERFALERAPAAAPARSVIYAIDTAGRLDTTVIGTWRDLNTSLVLVNLTTRNAQQSLTLAKTVAGFTVQPVPSFAPSRPLRIVRTSCPP